MGARPIYEPDLIVVVKDEGINDAKTISDVVRHLSEVVAFIELPDRIVAESEKLDGNLVTAINVARDWECWVSESRSSPRRNLSRRWKTWL
jgi:2-keto-4-pentenoate hydratase